MPPDAGSGRSRCAALVAAVALLPMAAAAASAGEGGCGSGGADPVFPADAPILSVTVRAERASYRNGDVAILPVSVHVGAQAGPPVAKAELTMTVTAGRYERTLGGTTSADGISNMRLKITGSIPRGPLGVTVSARSVLASGSDCQPGFVYAVGTGSADPVTQVKD